MLSCPMTLTARASLKKRSTIFSSCENCGCRTDRHPHPIPGGRPCRRTPCRPCRGVSPPVAADGAAIRSSNAGMSDSPRPSSGNEGLRHRTFLQSGQVRDTAVRVESRSYVVSSSRPTPRGSRLHWRSMRFAKLHGLGNDFLLLDLRAGGEPLPPRRRLSCATAPGVGGDGLLTSCRGNGCWCRTPTVPIPRCVEMAHDVQPSGSQPRLHPSGDRARRTAHGRGSPALPSMRAARRGAWSKWTWHRTDRIGAPVVAMGSASGIDGNPHG